MKYTIDDIIAEDNIDSDLVCPICCCLLVVSLSCKNGHNVCSNCIIKQMEIKNECSICCCPISYENLSKNRFLQKYINGLNVYCPYRYYNNEFDECDENDKSTTPTTILQIDEKHGCKEIITIEELLNGNHLKKCKFKFIDCVNSIECGQYRENQMEKHKEQCGYLINKCYHCKLNLTRMAMSEHLLYDCSELVILCRYKEGGCNAQIPRHQLSSHLTLYNNHEQFIANIINNHQMNFKKTSKQLKQLKISCEELETKLINNDYSFKGVWIVKNWNYHYEQYKSNPTANLIISPPIYLSPTKEFSLSLEPDCILNSVNCLSIILSKQFQSISTIQYSFEITNNQNTKSIKKEEKKKFGNLIGSGHSIEFPTSEIYNINNKYILNDQLIIKFNIKILSVQDDENDNYNNETEDDDEFNIGGGNNNVLITEKE